MHNGNLKIGSFHLFFNLLTNYALENPRMPVHLRVLELQVHLINIQIQTTPFMLMCIYFSNKLKKNILKILLVFNSSFRHVPT